jgi:hypothetical protein
MTKVQKESILVATKLLALAKDDEEKFSTMKKYLHSKISEVMNVSPQSNLRPTS